MTASTRKQVTGKELEKLVALLSASLADSLGSLVGQPVVIAAAQPALEEAATLLETLPRSCVVARGELDKALAGRCLATLLEVPDAIAMAGLLMLSPEDAIAQRRAAGRLEGQDAEAFGELGNVLFAAMGNVLREQFGDLGIRYLGHGIVQPGADPAGAFGSGKLFAHRFRIKVGQYPEAIGALVVDEATAEAWNKGPLELTAADAGSGAAMATEAAQTRADDEGLEGIPPAQVRGTLAAFVLETSAFRTLRRSCRRVGLELRRHGRGEIPNPAAHKNEVVLLDVPPGEERRFDWCRRVKENAATCKVVLLIHQPSKLRVAQAFLSKADVILGFPCEEQQLSQKLASLLSDGAEPPPAV